MSQPEPTLVERMAEAMRRHYIDTRRDVCDADGNCPCSCADWREGGDLDEYDWNAHMAEVAAAVVQRLLDAKDTEIERLNTELAGWQLHYDPPPRSIDSTPDISDYEEQT